MELDAIEPHPVMVMVVTLPWGLDTIPLAQRSRVDAMLDAHLQVHNAVVLLAPTGTKANTSRTSFAMHAGNPAMLRQTAMFLQSLSLLRSINGTSQTT
jgi:hypothetical protein